MEGKITFAFWEILHFHASITCRNKTKKITYSLLGIYLLTQKGTHQTKKSSRSSQNVPRALNLKITSPSFHLDLENSIHRLSPTQSIFSKSLRHVFESRNSYKSHPVSLLTSEGQKYYKVCISCWWPYWPSKIPFPKRKSRDLRD